MLRVSLEPCWILHRRPWRESSVIVDGLTRDHGRISLVARGARRPASALRGLTEPFRPLLVSFSLRGEMGSLTGLESAGPALGLNGEGLWCGFYVNELMIRLLPSQEPSPVLFDCYALETARLWDPIQRAPALRRLEMALLFETGVAPDLLHDVSNGEAVSSEGWYRLADETGPVAVAGPGRGHFPGSAFIALANGRFETVQAGREPRQIMSRLLSFHLGDQPLHTRKMMRGEHG